MRVRAPLPAALLCALAMSAYAPHTARADEPAVDAAPSSDTVARGASTTPVVRIPIEGPFAGADAEVSGLSWAPGPDGQPVLLWLAEERLAFDAGVHTPLGHAPRAEVLDAAARAVRGQPGPALLPRPVRWVLPAPLVAREGRTPEAGFEAVAVVGDRIAVAREQGGAAGASLLLEGRLRVLDGAFSAVFDRAREIPAPALRVGLTEEDARELRRNKSYEALLGLRDGWLLLHECGGATFAPADGSALRPVVMPHVPYRITDAGALGPDGRFLVMNYHFRGRECLPDADELARDILEGGTPAGGEHVERLLALAWRGGAVHRVDAPPTWLRLEAEARNWEGLVAVRDVQRGLAGALLVTDRWPLAAGGTLFAYVPGAELVRPAVSLVRTDSRVRPVRPCHPR